MSYLLVLFLLLAFPSHGSFDQSILSLSELLPKKEVMNPDASEFPFEMAPPVESQQMKLLPHFDDPLWSKQWNLHNKDNPTRDINVLPVWQAGYTGEGVKIALLDDGI